MKTKSSLFFFAVFLFGNLSAQKTYDYKITRLITGGGINYEIIGSASNSFADSLFSHFPEQKRKGYIWKFKHVQIAGIEKPLTFQVHQGISGVTKSFSDTSITTGGYFHTFTSEKYKQKLLTNKKPSETYGLIIYLKRGRKYGIQDEQEAELVKAYLLAIYGEK